MTPPFITAVCPTFGRVGWLNESVACWLKQDYTGSHELIIVNSFPEQHLQGDFDNVRIVNLTQRPSSLGECRNIGIEIAQGSHICIWDDDDLPLPPFVSTFAHYFADSSVEWVWLSSQFYSENWQIKRISRGGTPVFAFKKSAWRKVGGYPPLGVAEDRELISKITQNHHGVRIQLQPEEIPFIYGWGNGIFHTSGLGPDGPTHAPAHERVAADLQRRIREGSEPIGPIVLQPKLKHDYAAMAKAFVDDIREKAKAQSVAIVQVGRYGDIVNILPIALWINNNYAKPHIVCGREFADLLDGCSYVTAYPVDLRHDQANEAIEIARREFKHVLVTQVWGQNYSVEKKCEAYNKESWRVAGFLRKFHDPTWKPLFDKEDLERSHAVKSKLLAGLNTNKPTILTSLSAGFSSPYLAAPVVMNALVGRLGKSCNIIDISELRLERPYDLLSIMRLAKLVISNDSLLLHLAAATWRPLIAIVNPIDWLGSIPRSDRYKRFNYYEAAQNPEQIAAAADEMRDISLTPMDDWPYQPLIPTNPPLRALYHTVERHEEARIHEKYRKEPAWRSWEVLYAEKGVLPAHLTKYARSAKEIGDDKELPFLKDVLKYGLNHCASDHDIVMFTNDDLFLHPQCPDAVRFYASVWGACFAERCEFSGPMLPPTSSPEEFDKASQRHIGRDLFAFTGGWLRAHWDEIPDFILGASKWDLALSYLIQATGGREMPRGFVAHQKHDAAWMTKERKRSASENWNGILYGQFFTKLAL